MNRLRNSMAQAMNLPGACEFHGVERCATPEHWPEDEAALYRKPWRSRALRAAVIQTRRNEKRADAATALLMRWLQAWLTGRQAKRIAITALRHTAEQREDNRSPADIEADVTALLDALSEGLTSLRAQEWNT